MNEEIIKISSLFFKLLFTQLHHHASLNLRSTFKILTMNHWIKNYHLINRIGSTLSYCCCCKPLGLPSCWGDFPLMIIFHFNQTRLPLSISPKVHQKSYKDSIFLPPRIHSWTKAQNNAPVSSTYTRKQKKY